MKLFGLMRVFLIIVFCYMSCMGPAIVRPPANKEGEARSRNPLARSRTSPNRADQGLKLSERGEFLRVRPGARSAGQSQGPLDRAPYVFEAFCYRGF